MAQLITLILLVLAAAATLADFVTLASFLLGGALVAIGWELRARVGGPQKGD